MSRLIKLHNNLATMPNMSINAAIKRITVIEGGFAKTTVKS